MHSRHHVRLGLLRPLPFVTNLLQPLRGGNHLPRLRSPWFLFLRVRTSGQSLPMGQAGGDHTGRPEVDTDRSRSGYGKGCSQIRYASVVTASSGTEWLAVAEPVALGCACASGCPPLTGIWKCIHACAFIHTLCECINNITCTARLYIHTHGHACRRA